MKIYTRTGDDGTTGLLGPGRVLKCVPRVEAYGSVDELNAVLGVARAHDTHGWLANELEALQSRLFSLGAELAAADPAMLGNLERIADGDVAGLERLIDRLEAELPPLKSFILPGGAAAGRTPAPGDDRARPGALSQPARGPVVRHGTLVEPARAGRRCRVARGQALKGCPGPRSADDSRAGHCAPAR
jgi:hypothetical protein